MTQGAAWVADADGTDARKLIGSQGWMSQVDPEALWPMWSPDGSRIAFQRLYSTKVIVLDVLTGRPTKVGAGTDPTWLDDHTLIVENYDAP